MKPNRLTVLLAVAATAALARAPLPAAASDTDPVVFAGTIAPTPPIPDVGGTGSLTYTNGACEMVSSDGEFGECDLKGSGNYFSIVCGTGSAHATLSMTEHPDGDLETFGVDIVYVAGIGVAQGPGGVGVGVLVPLETGPPPTCTTDVEVAGVLVLTA